MSPKNKHIVVLIFLITLALFVGHNSNPQNSVNAQIEGNLQINEIPFNVSSTQIIDSPDVQTIHVPDLGHLEEYVLKDTPVQILDEDGSLDNFVYLPMVYIDIANYFDDFSNPNSGFPVFDTSVNTYQYVNGEYQILNKTNGYLGAVSYGHKLEQFEFGVSMRRIGSARGFYGIVFWLDDTWNDYYLLMLSPDDGQYYFFHYQSSSGFSLLSQSINYPYINLGNAVNRIEMKQYFIPNLGVGLQLETQITINDIGSANINSVVPEGAYRVGFFAAPIDANHDVRFDDYLFKSYCVLYSWCSN